MGTAKEQAHRLMVAERTLEVWKDARRPCLIPAADPAWSLRGGLIIRTTRVGG